MPRKEIDYSKTIIYKIVCDDIDISECYVGHTTEFTKRKYKHKYSCNTETHHTHNYNVYKFIRSNNGWDNWSMIEIEKYPCIDANEACSRERYWLEILKATLNMNIPTRTLTERNETNKVELKLKKQLNYLNNKNPEKEKEYRDKNAERIKKYREENRENFNEKQKIKRNAKKLLNV